MNKNKFPGGYFRMKLNFTKKQYQQLMELLYLGEWTANSSRDFEDRNKEYDELFQYVSSFAKDFGFDEQITFDKKMKEYYPTPEFERKLDPYIEHNDNDIFWNELTMRLAKRDVQKNNEEFETHEEYVERLFEIEEIYETEFEENGLENVVVKGVKP